MIRVKMCIKGQRLDTAGQIISRTPVIFGVWAPKWIASDATCEQL